MERYVCVHGHFYQPPRENPWLGTIEVQDEVFPYHDWNERVAAECYGPNARSRILNGEGRIERIVNNYAQISFNFGPTLLSWLAENAGEVYEAVLAADRQSQDRFSGHGSALAQAYNHMILPLATRRDRQTQVVWGIRDFERRFGRRPEGMWLPETAVDLDTLDLLAEQGIHFTILAPHQARRVRNLAGGAWQDVGDARIDPSRAYEAHLPSGRRLSLFFYDGPSSRAVAFEQLLSRGEDFAQRILGGFAASRPWPQLAHIATDGETYGHHHRFGDMALAYALEYIQANNLAVLTNYGEFLERFPPTQEVEIVERTSWSCGHGVERWQADCGCNTGRHPGWSQAWRQPLREALDWLRDDLQARCEERGQALFRDLWAARDDYIDVVLARRPETIDRFLDRHVRRGLQGDERITALKLLEIQHHAMLMYTSCGWFFDDVSGIETVQILQYAGRAVQLAQDVFGDGIEEHFLRRLALARSNDPRSGDGAVIYEKLVATAKVDLAKVASHYAVSSLFQPYEDEAKVYLYTVQREDLHRTVTGRTQLAIGRVRVCSDVTGESAPLSFAVLHFGDHNINGGVGPFRGEDEYRDLVERASAAFAAADITEVIRIIDDHFPGPPFSLRSLFRDEQREIVRLILEPSMQEAESIYREFYREHVSLMRFLASIGFPVPNRFRTAAEIALNLELRRAVGVDDIDANRIRAIDDEATRAGVALDAAGVSLAIEQTINRLAERFRADPLDPVLLEKLRCAVEVGSQPPFAADLWRTQNVVFDVREEACAPALERSKRGDESAREWLARFAALARALNVRIGAT